VYSAFLRWFLLTVGGLAARMIFKVTVVGTENLPDQEPVIVISNHFSWFDGALLTLNRNAVNAWMRLRKNSCSTWPYFFRRHIRVPTAASLPMISLIIKRSSYEDCSRQSES
jgi:hypothetical protein